MKLTIVVDKVLYSALASAPETTSAAASSSSTVTPETLTTASTTAAAGGPAGTATLHVSGKVSSENPHVKKGAFHTLDFEVGRDFTIIKQPGEWDSIARERIREVTEPGRGAEVGAIVCGEGGGWCHAMSDGHASLTSSSLSGLANICVITNHTTIIRQRIDVPVPRKRKGGTTALGADKV